MVTTLYDECQACTGILQQWKTLDNILYFAQWLDGESGEGGGGELSDVLKLSHELQMRNPKGLTTQWLMFFADIFHNSPDYNVYS